MSVFQNAQWIFVDGVSADVRDRYFNYQSTFTLNNPRDATLYISAYSQYAVYLNGQFVNCGQMAGYEHLQFYDTLDITDFLVPGENTLLVQQYVCGADFSTEHKQIPGVIFALYNENTPVLVSSPDCLSRPNHRYLKNEEPISAQLNFNFEYDANQPEASFAPSIPAAKEQHLVPRPIKKLDILPPTEGKIVAQGLFRENDASLPKAQRMHTAWLSAFRHDKLGDGTTWTIPKDRTADGIYLISDLGGESAGLLTFSLDVPKETEILIGFGEHLDDLRVRSAIGGRNFCLRYIAKPGHNEFFHPFLRLGLRYLQLHVYADSFTLHQLAIRQTVYPLNYLPIPTDDGFFRKVYEVGRKTLHLCMHEHYEDCPWREQSLYTMDSRVQMLCGYYAFGEYAFPRASLRLMAHSLREDKMLELCAPGKVPVNIPSFTAVYLRQILEYTQFSKDFTLAEEVFDVMKTIVDGFLSRIDKTGLPPLYHGQAAWNFYEWQPGLNGYDRHETDVYECPWGAFVSDSLHCFAQVCQMLRPELADIYLSARDKLNQVLHQTFFDEKTGAYLTRLGDAAPRHTLTQALMLYIGAVPQEHADRVAQAITAGQLIPSSVSMSIYVYEALLKLGNSFRDYVLSHIRQTWTTMLYTGTDTFWETIVGADDFYFAGSLCHGWASVPIYIMNHYNLW